MTLPAWVFGILGAVVGSFLNVCIDRLPEDKSLLSPPSHCPDCERRLQPHELIPILSYLYLGGRCRTCQTRIPLRILLVEVGTAVLFWLAWRRAGTGWMALYFFVNISLLITIGVIDLEHERVLNTLVYPGVIWAGIAIPLFHASAPWNHLVGGGLGFVTLLLIALIASGAMGMGDVKLGLFMGLILGFPDIILAYLIAFITGGLIAGILLLLKKIGRKDTIAFGPFLATAGIITLLYGDLILRWWLRRIT